MKLSEAILLGSISTGQAFGVFRSRGNNTCALGAAMEATGIVTVNPDSFFELARRFPILYKSVTNDCGCCGPPYPITLSEYIPHLNDKHRLTRPQIAQIVAEYEAKYATDHTADAPYCEPHMDQSETPHAVDLGG